MATIGQALTGKRRVGDDQAVQIMHQRFGGDVIQPFLGKIRGDLQEYRQRASKPDRLLGAGGKDGLQQRLQAVARLQVAKAGRIRRGNVDGEIARDRIEATDAGDIVRHAVGAVLVGADIDPDDAGGIAARREPREGRLVPLVVEAEPVDHRPVGGQPEDARPVVAGLRLRRHRADFRKAEAELQQCVRNFGILVVSGGHAERVRKREPGDAAGKTRVLREPAGGNDAALERGD